MPAVNGLGGTARCLEFSRFNTNEEGLRLALAAVDCSTPPTPWHGRPGHNLCKCARNVDSGYSGIFRIPGHTHHTLSRKRHIFGERIRYFGPYMPPRACIFPRNQRQALRILPSSLRPLLLGKRRSIGRTPGRRYSIRGCRFHIESSSWRSPMEWGISARIPSSTFHATSAITSLLKRRDGTAELNPTAEPTLYSVSTHLSNVAPRRDASFLGSLRTSYRTRLAVTPASDPWPHLARARAHDCYASRSTDLSRSEFPITLTEDKAMAAAAIMGESNIPKTG